MRWRIHVYYANGYESMDLDAPNTIEAVAKAMKQLKAKARLRSARVVTRVEVNPVAIT